MYVLGNYLPSNRARLPFSFIDIQRKFIFLQRINGQVTSAIQWIYGYGT